MAETGNLIEAIGRTPLVQLRRIVPPRSARVMAKLESANPTGSMKDRMARAMVERAAADGRLAPGGTIVEQLIKTMIARAGEISRRPGHWWADQLNNAVTRTRPRRCA